MCVPALYLAFKNRPLRLQGMGKETKMEIIESSQNVQMSQSIDVSTNC